MALCATGIFAWYVVDHVGGWAEVLRQIHLQFADSQSEGIAADQLLSFTPSHAKDVSVALLIVLSLQWLLQMNADGTGYLAQRTMACRSDRDATQAAVTFTFLQVLMRSLIWIPLGLGLLVLFPLTRNCPLVHCRPTGNSPLCVALRTRCRPGSRGSCSRECWRPLPRPLIRNSIGARLTGRRISMAGSSAAGCSIACPPTVSRSGWPGFPMWEPWLARWQLRRCCPRSRQPGG